jgi:hypothetical protein
MKTNRTWLWMLAVNALTLGVLGLYQLGGAAQPATNIPFVPSGAPADQRNEMVAQLKEVNAQLKEITALLKSGGLKVTIVLPEERESK